MTKNLKCTCDHEFQDRQYGFSVRVHNKMTKDKEYRCTVCQKVNKG